MPEGAWIDLLDPDAAALEAAVPYELHPSARERLLNPTEHSDERRPRLQQHDHYVFGVLVVPHLVGTDLAFQEIDLIVDRERIVTVRRTSPDVEPFDVEPIRRSAGSTSPGRALYLLVDEVAEQLLTLVDGIDEAIDDLEDHVEEWEGSAIRARVSELRHDILRSRRVVTPTRDLARAVLDDRVDLPGEPPLFPREVEIHFTDVYDKLLRASDGLELSRDLLAGVRDYHQTMIATEQNEVTKRLTAIASLVLLPTFIVGLYGQNLRIPEFDWVHGYAWSWALIAVTTIAQLVYFRRKRWI
jgi:magnesium transporter